MKGLFFTPQTGIESTDWNFRPNLGHHEFPPLHQPGDVWKPPFGAVFLFSEVLIKCFQGLVGQDHKPPATDLFDQMKGSAPPVPSEDRRAARFAPPSLHPSGPKRAEPPETVATPPPKPNSKRNVTPARRKL